MGREARLKQVIEALGNVLRGRIDRGEIREIVEELMVKGGNDGAQLGFDSREVLKQADGVEVVAAQLKADAVVVAVRVLALAAVTAQGMTGGKGFFHADLEHRIIIAKEPGRLGGAAIAAAHPMAGSEQ